ncbi:hypothetical protein B0H17DRAFT_1132835 [Mycena rosella]|uniref:CxC5 like cysteine cluster associated with KDZ domain-containing protein n=1 Tax=Mycena rosella TaxID=1033263 RepID=A0AAD7DK95_MYCRO|nr:hypothetical protein B0H17DRAFT_1132835 [Mycena rosella]
MRKYEDEDEGSRAAKSKQSERKENINTANHPKKLIKKRTSHAPSAPTPSSGRSCIASAASSGLRRLFRARASAFALSAVELDAELSFSFAEEEGDEEGEKKEADDRDKNEEPVAGVLGNAPGMRTATSRVELGRPSTGAWSARRDHTGRPRSSSSSSASALAFGEARSCRVCEAEHRCQRAGRWATVDKGDEGREEEAEAKNGDTRDLFNCADQCSLGRCGSMFAWSMQQHRPAHIDPKPVSYVQQVDGGPQIIGNEFRLFPKFQEVKRKGSRAKLKALNFHGLNQFLRMACLVMQTIAFQQLGQTCWAAFKDILWDHPMITPTDEEIITYNNAALGNGTAYRHIYPPVRVCSNPECTNHRNINDIMTLTDPLTHKATLYMLQSGVLPVYMSSFYCRSCNRRYYHNYYVHKQSLLRTYYGGVPNVIQVAQHFFTETRVQRPSKIAVRVDG